MNDLSSVSLEIVTSVQSSAVEKQNLLLLESFDVLSLPKYDFKI